MPNSKTRDFTGVELLAVGTWQGHGCPADGCEFTRADLDGLVSAYEATKTDLHAPVKLGHEQPHDGVEASGWVENLRRVGQKLVGDLKAVPADVADKIDTGRYRTRSAELTPDMEIGGETYPMVFTGLALLGASLPAVSGLADITKLYQSLRLTLDPKVRALLFTLPANVSYSDLSLRIQDAVADTFPGICTNMGGGGPDCWIADVFEGYAIVCGMGSDYWRVEYAVDAAGAVTLSGQPTEVMRQSVWVPEMDADDVGLSRRDLAAVHAPGVKAFDPVGELETFLGKMDERLKGSKGMPAMRTLLRETLAKLKGLASKQEPPAKLGRSTSEDEMDLATMRTTLGLADDATEEVILAEVAKLKTASSEQVTELSAVTKRLLTLETNNAVAEANAKIDTAVKNGQILPASRDSVLKMALRAPEEFDAFIAAQPKRIEFGERGSSNVTVDEQIAGLEPTETAIGIAMQMGETRQSARVMLIRQAAIDKNVDLPADFGKVPATA